MKVGICGLGMMGGSLGLALDPAHLVLGYDPSPQARAEAMRRKAVSAIVDSPTDLAGCDLVVLTGPPDSIAAAAREVLRSGSSIVTDIAGVKTPIVAALEGAPGVERFVGGHPMAGNEFAGVQHADPGIFSGAAWILTPTEATAPTSIEAVEGLVRSLGCIPRRMTPADHDDQVALVSHLPNLLANLLLLIGAERGASDLAGGSFKDLTRVAGGNPALWATLLDLNRTYVGAWCAELRERLAAVEAKLQARDTDHIFALFERAAQVKGGRP